MNNSKTPKIVIGVGLAAVYAAGLGYFTLRGEHDNAIAQTSTASTAQIAPEPVAPTDNVPASADSSTSVADQLAVTAPAAQPEVAPQPVVSAAAKAEASPATGQSDARLRSKEQTIAGVTTAAPLEKPDVAKSSPASEITSAVSEPANAAGDAPATVEASAPSGNDSQITADVKSQIAAVAPAGTIDVTTRDGVVELTGSVPSEEVIDRARLAARNVADVRGVDVSALMVSN